MWQNLFRDASFFRFMLHADAEEAERTRAERCPYCRAPLHAADYKRKPRGGARYIIRSLGPAFLKRFSFCCSREGCRSRVTPTSLRFLGRRVYLGVVVVLAAALQHGITDARVAALQPYFPTSRTTLARWREWWLATFPAGPFWQVFRSRFAPPIAETRIPASPLARFAGDLPERLRLFLEFLRPITSPSTPL